MGYGGKETCPRCGRVLIGFQPCPNCTAGGYSDSYQAYGQGVSAPTVGPRLVLLLGAIVLLSVLVFLVAPRGGSKSSGHPTIAQRKEPGDGSQKSGGGVLGVRPVERSVDDPSNAQTPAAQVTVAPKVSSKKAKGISAIPAPEATPNAAEDEEFWRKKLERDLREVGEYTLTEDEKAYMEQMRWQDHVSLSDQARVSDYYLRRPELTRNRR